jgi:hypothetical protein
MSVEERRRIALHRAAAGTWGEEVADTLVELVAPSGHELATRQDIERVLAAMTAMEDRWEQRSEAWAHRLEATEHRLSVTFERRITDAVSLQTRTLVISQLVALVVIAGLAFGLS